MPSGSLPPDPSPASRGSGEIQGGPITPPPDCAVALVGVDAEGRVTAWGPDAEALFGWTAEEAVGRCCPPVPEHLAARFLEWVREARDSLAPAGCALDLGHRDGAPIQAHLTRCPQLKHRAGDVYFLVVARGSAPAANELIELARSQERLRLALEATSDGVWDMDARNRTMVWDEGCCRILGLAQGDLGPECADFEALVHPDDIPHVLEAYCSRAREGAGRFSAVFRARHRGGHWVWLLSRGRVAEWDVDGAPTRIVGTHTDISEQHTAEEALRESEAQHRLLVEQSGEGVATTDLEERITYANPAASRIFGVAREELVGASVLSFVPPEEHDTIRQGTARRVRGESSTYEHTLLRGDGQQRRILVTGTPNLDSSGTVVGSYGVFRDVTDEREAEEQRRTVGARLAQTQRIEGLFSMAAGVAHDFSNMLMGVLGNTALALAHAPVDSPLRPYLEHIHTAATEAGDLAKQLLTYSGGGVVALEPLDLSEVVEDVRHLLESVVPEGVDLQIELGSDLPHAHGDAAQLSQVIVNLVTNAYEALEGHDGEIMLRTFQTTLDEADWGRSYLQPDATPSRCVALEVRDGGQGIPEHVLERIFDPFFSTRITGRGLGLPAALGIVRGHGGGIWVSSRPGAGTQVRVALPCIDEPESVEGEPSGASPGRKVILIVDDQLNVRLVLSAWLSATEQFDVVTASDGESAVSLIAERPDQFDLVVMDLSMPRMDGSEAMGRIRAMRPDLPIILSSGYGERTVRSRLRGQDPTAFVQKPYEPQVMVDLIQSILG